MGCQARILATIPSIRPQWKNHLESSVILPTLVEAYVTWLQSWWNSLHQFVIQGDTCSLELFFFDVGRKVKYPTILAAGATGVERTIPETIRIVKFNWVSAFDTSFDTWQLFNHTRLQYSAPQDFGASLPKMLFLLLSFFEDWTDVVWVSISMSSADYLLAYNNMIHSTTGVSPAMLMFGRELRDKLPELGGTIESSSPFWRHEKQRFKNERETYGKCWREKKSKFGNESRKEDDAEEDEDEKQWNWLKKETMCFLRINRRNRL